MGIQIKENYGYTSKGSTLHEWIAKELDGTDYDGGELEDIKRTTDNLKDALGRLVHKLHEKGVLDLPEVAEVVRGQGCGQSIELDEFYIDENEI